MKKVFAGEIYEALPLSNGLIFSYCKETVDEQVIVSYKMISFDTGKFTDVAKNIYQLSKFSNNYKAVAMQCENYITTKALTLLGGKTFLLDTDGSARLLDVNAEAIWEGELRYKGFAPSDIVLYKNALWACYSKVNVLLRFNLNTMREELRIGGSRSPFNAPSALFIDGDNVMVSNSGSSNLLQVNLNSYTVVDYQQFEEPVYQYVRVKDFRFVVLKSGLYVL